MNLLDPSKAQFEHKPSGYILFDDKEVAHTLQCKHCNAHYVSVKGSGVRRGWCLHCKGPLCGRPTCDVCVPFEAKLAVYDDFDLGEKKLAVNKYWQEIGFLSKTGQPLI